ncbi:MAG: type II secretion system protein [Spirochaetes bacterium]|jgi:prepilin-type N-terminal cleavage/methylation domain-containing protein|nr:type II secretion system protein [Spirochaetota bacterium]
MLTSQAGNKSEIRGNQGFSLVEILIVIALLSIISAVVAPRISSFFDSPKKNISLVSSIIVKTFDDAFVNNRINLLAVHLYFPATADFDDINKEILERTNGLSIVTVAPDGVLSDSSNRMLKTREFATSFMINRVLFADGRDITSGTALIPFYPDGFTKNVIIHVTVEDTERYSIIISKLMKYPYVKEDHIDFESMWKSGF